MTRFPLGNTSISQSNNAWRYYIKLYIRISAVIDFIALRELQRSICNFEINFEIKNSFVRTVSHQAEAEMDLEVGAADEAESFTTQAL